MFMLTPQKVAELVDWPDRSRSKEIGKAKIVRAVRSPLGFFVLALLIVESFLLGAGIWFNLPEVWRIAAIGVGVILFLIVFFHCRYSRCSLSPKFGI